MRGFSLFKKIPNWDDLTFLPGTLTRFVIEGYREKCLTETIIGPKAKRPLVLDIPIYITGMSFGALSYEAKMALARGATMAGTATCSGEGGMIPDERRYSSKWFYQCIQSRYGFNPHHLRLADCCEFFIGQGCKVGLGGHLMGQKVTDQVAEMRSLPAGIDQRSPGAASRLARPRRSGAQDPGDPRSDQLGDSDPAEARRRARLRRRAHGRQDAGPTASTSTAWKAAPGAGPHIATEETGVPGIAAIRQARKALDDVGKTGRDLARLRRRHQQRRRRRQGAGARRRRGGDRPRGADGAQLQQGHSRRPTTRAKWGSRPATATTATRAAARWAITTQDPVLRKRLDPDEAAERVYNFLHTLAIECQMMARACGKTNVHSLEPEDLAALTMEASALAMVPLAGTQHTVGRPDMTRY